MSNMLAVMKSGGAARPFKSVDWGQNEALSVFGTIRVSIYMDRLAQRRSGRCESLPIVGKIWMRTTIGWRTEFE